MRKYIMLGYLISTGFVGDVLACQGNLAYELLTQEKHVFDDLPLEMQNDLALEILKTHLPLMLFIVREVFMKSASLTPSLQLLQGHTDTILAAQFTGSGDKVVSASVDQTAKIWDVASRNCLHTLRGHVALVQSAQFSTLGDKVVTGSHDNTAKIWDVASGTCLRTVGHASFVRFAGFNGAGDKIVTASADSTACIWDVQTGACLQVLIGHTDSVELAQFNTSGDRILTASRDMTARIWDASTGQCLHLLQGHTNAVTAAYFTPSGNEVITFSDDNTTKLWDARNGACLRTFDRNTLGAYSVSDFSGGKRHTASGDKMLLASGNTVKMWSMNRIIGGLQAFRSKLTHRHAFLLVAIYEAVICRALVKKHGIRAFENPVYALSHDQVKFDFNTCSHLQEAFNTLPPEIQESIRPFVVEVSRQNSLHDDAENIK
jgi:WD40 repeat protein